MTALEMKYLPTGIGEMIGGIKVASIANETLPTFLSTGAISQAQHDKSLNCLIEKMGIKDDQQ